MLLDGVRPRREFCCQLLSHRGQPQRDDPPVLGPGIPPDQTLLLQRAYGVAHRGLGELELSGQLADPPELETVIEQVDEELGLYRAQAVLLRLLPEQDAEDLGEPLQRGDDLGAYVPVLGV